MGVDVFASGWAAGFGMCLNDGDVEDGQGGQKGWTGWGPYSIVYGKNSPACGLITLAGGSVSLNDPNRACGPTGSNNLAVPGAGEISHPPAHPPTRLLTAHTRQHTRSRHIEGDEDQKRTL